MSNLLLMDQSSLMHQGFHTSGHLQHRGVETGILYGFINCLISYVKWCDKYKACPIRLVVCQDSKPYIRSEIYPEYKSNRKGNDDPGKARMFRQAFYQIVKFMDLAGIEYVGQPGLEADDIMAILAKKYHKDYTHVLLGSSDSDLNQLLDITNLTLLKGKPAALTPYNHISFTSEYPELDSARLWHRVEALTGGHNGLPGIKTIGYKKALAYLTGGKLSDKDRGLIEREISHVSGFYRLSMLPIISGDYFRIVSLKSRSDQPKPDYSGLNNYLSGLGFTALNSIVGFIRKIDERQT